MSCFSSLNRFIVSVRFSSTTCFCLPCLQYCTVLYCSKKPGLSCAIAQEERVSRVKPASLTIGQSQREELRQQRHQWITEEPGHMVHVLATLMHSLSSACPLLLSPFNRTLCRGDLSMGVNGSVVTLSLQMGLSDTNQRQCVVSVGSLYWFVSSAFNVR